LRVAGWRNFFHGVFRRRCSHFPWVLRQCPSNETRKSARGLVSFFSLRHPVGLCQIHY
jgi:hypothetical protein